eukprot:1181247-Prorocentrum_minimum.AAC.1
MMRRLSRQDTTRLASVVAVVPGRVSYLKFKYQHLVTPLLPERTNRRRRETAFHPSAQVLDRATSLAKKQAAQLKAAAPAATHPTPAAKVPSPSPTAPAPTAAPAPAPTTPPATEPAEATAAT